MSKNFLIGLDLDGIVYQWDSTARFMLRHHISSEGRQPATELFFPSLDYNSIQSMVTEEDWQWLWTDAITDGLFRYGHVEQGAMEGVRDLANLGDIVVITSRPKAAVNDTIGWLAMMFGRIPLAGVVIQSNGQNKSDVHPTPNVYIDDMPHIADDILDRTHSSLVMLDQPWNQGYEGGPEELFLRRLRLFRAKGWTDVVRAVKSIKEAGL